LGRDVELSNLAQVLWIWGLVSRQAFAIPGRFVHLGAATHMCRERAP
jgi:hypothetical protein